MRQRAGFKIAFVVWVVALVGWVCLLGLERATMGPTSCELATGSSIYGDASWSWLPPGVRCEWGTEVEGEPVRIAEDPPVARVGTAIVFLLWGGSLWVLSRRGAKPVGQN